MSHRYGSRFLKSAVDENEFKIIRNEMNNFDDNENDSLRNTFDFCYDLDENCIKNRVYKLKSISHIIEGLKVGALENSNLNQTFFTFVS